MSKRVTLPGGQTLDMNDPEAIRSHAMKVIAEVSVQESGFHQTRLAAANRLLEIAAELEARKPKQPEAPKLPPEEAARLIRLKLQERG